jgi:hypothetical protein
MNEEFLVDAVHQTASNTSLPFVSQKSILYTGG